MVPFPSQLSKSLRDGKEIISSLCTVPSKIMLVFPVQLETGGHGFQSLLELVVDGLRRRALALQRRLRVGHHTLRGAAHADDSRVRERKLESVRRADLGWERALTGPASPRSPANVLRPVLKYFVSTKNN